MGVLQAQDEVTGVLARTDAHDGRLMLRLCPHTLPVDSDGPCVTVVTFEEPAFEERDLAPFLGLEVQILARGTRAELFELFDPGPPLVLQAASIDIRQERPDHRDLIERITALAAEVDHLQASLNEARKDIENGRKHVRELLRRAQIKAAASEEHAVRQAATVDALQQVLRHLGEET
jgi:hypothetical protein